MASDKSLAQAEKTARAGMRSLEEVEALYGGLIETLPAIVYVAEPRPPYATIYVSPSIELLGFTLEEWLARPDAWVNLIHDEDRPWVLKQTQEAVSQRRENDYEYRVVAKDGSTRWLHDRGRFILDDRGEPICWQGVLLDITQRKRAEEEREAVIQQLRKAVAEIKTLSGLLPICSYCKKVRTDENYWQAIEHYVSERSAAQFSHGICPECWESIVQPQL